MDWLQSCLENKEIHLAEQLAEEGKLGIALTLCNRLACTQKLVEVLTHERLYESPNSKVNLVLFTVHQNAVWLMRTLGVYVRSLSGDSAAISQVLLLLAKLLERVPKSSSGFFLCCVFSHFDQIFHSPI